MGAGGGFAIASLGSVWTVNELFKQLRFCAACGSGVGSIEWLCSSCAVKLTERMSICSRRVGQGLTHSYLFEWAHGDVFMDRIVYSLKGGARRPVFSGLAHVIAAHAEYRGSRVFYPSWGKKDHASCLAEQLAQVLGLEAEPILKKSRRKQALLRKRERKTLAFVGVSHSTSKALLVDDIVTSGATVEACYLALGQPKEFQAWSLFYRKSL